MERLIYMNNPNIKTLEGMKPSGRITVRSLRAGTVEVINSVISKFGRTEKSAHLIKSLIEHNTLGTPIVQSNLIMQGSSTGKDLLVKWLLSYYNNSNLGLGVNYGAIGSGSTAPAVTDTQLQTEVARVLVTLGTETGYNAAQFQFFFADASLANGSYREFGTFVGGTASANTGSIFNRALFASTYTKAAGTDTTVEVDITFN